MPLHDWSRVPSGLFHHFHQSWSIRIVDSLNAGRLPREFTALVEQRVGPVEADVLAIEARSRQLQDELSGGVAVAQQPLTPYVRRSSKEIYSGRANRIVVKHHLGRIVSVIEIVSPGNKNTRSALRDFVEKTIDYLKRHVHVLVIDVFPPSPRDPCGLHKAIWDEVEEEPFVFPDTQDRMAASYQAGREKAAYVEPFGLGEKLPNMPLFLTTDVHVTVPLEQTYCATWEASPPIFREAVETGSLLATLIQRTNRESTELVDTS